MLHRIRVPVIFILSLSSLTESASFQISDLDIHLPFTEVCPCQRLAGRTGPLAATMDTSSYPSILLKNGILLLHDERDNVQILQGGDVFIINGLIAEIAQNISPNEETEVIDCTEKIICPGFIDAHHHVWQTQLKGRHTDDSLLDYHPRGEHDPAGLQPLGPEC